MPAFLLGLVFDTERLRFCLFPGEGGGCSEGRLKQNSEWVGKSLRMEITKINDAKYLVN